MKEKLFLDKSNINAYTIISAYMYYYAVCFRGTSLSTPTIFSIFISDDVRIIVLLIIVRRARTISFSLLNHPRRLSVDILKSNHTTEISAPSSYSCDLPSTHRWGRFDPL